MGNRKFQIERCERCMMHLDRCICDEVEVLTIDTRLAFVMHRREVAKPTNTGRLVMLTIPATELYVRGVEGRELALEGLETPDRRTWVLFPGEDAEPITRELVDADPRPITLIVPDGTWAQARRVARREPVIGRARRVRPADGPPTRYRLRHEHVPGGLATAEAVARALGVIEGRPVQRAIERLFDTMVSRTLEARNGLPARVGLPDDESGGAIGG